MSFEEPLPFPTSLCHRCGNHKLVKAARSVFILCPVYPAKYPPQPVSRCAWFQPSPAVPPPGSNDDES